MLTVSSVRTYHVMARIVPVVNHFEDMQRQVIPDYEFAELPKLLK